MARILLIDDNPDIRATLGLVLTVAGHAVTTAASGEEGLEATSETIFDVILLDMLMPQQDGVATYHAFRDQEITRHVPIILLTAMAVEGHWEELPDEGGGPCYVMGKPYQTSLLLARVNQLLGGVDPSAGDEPPP